MLGIIGFLTLAAVIGVYVYTSHIQYTLVPFREKRLFVTAYGLLAIAALIWATTFVVEPQSVSALVYTADIILVMATGAMLGVLIDIGRPQIFALLTLAAAGLLAVRAFVLPSTAYVADGLLFFDLAPEESLVIGLLFLAIWLPATIKIVYLALRSQRLIPLRNVVSFIFVSTVLMTGFFLAARRPEMIVVTFTSIVILFAILVAVNMLLKRIESNSGGHRVKHG